ncbi:MAG: U32 family peptidase [Betaproteobacteria bacterium]|nr:MAG: U32 family peptidase [Betaproteobacteria bacterium]
MSLPRHHLELLSPAKNIDIGREAVLHGADAVYIGGPLFGARAKAENSVAEIADLVKFAHRYGSRIFVTLNTILHDSELEAARKLIHEYWNAGVDALIVQDMGILELDIPPIQLHASTQTDIRTLEKAKFMGEVGFSQIVLAREVTLKQIAAMRAEVNPDVTLEYFIHGALCVAFSGNCYISHAHTGRSANRGECAQECRLPYTLQDKDGQVVAFDKHLLSMKDNDQSANLRMLVDAGIRSFKIEGRYKDLRYVKNITAHYRTLLDEILNERPELARASHGECTFTFTPDAEKTFNRSSTDYFANGRKDDIGAFDAPTHVGGELGRVLRVAADWFELETTDSTDSLANGDGLTYMNKREVRGMQANTAKKIGNVWRVSPNQAMRDLAGLTVGTVIHRNRDHAWEQVLAKPSADRRVSLALSFSETADGFALAATDESGATVCAQIAHPKEAATQPERAEASLRENLGKLGQTIFIAKRISVAWQQAYFVPASIANQLRREVIAALEAARSAALVRPLRAEATLPLAAYPETSLTYLANVYNQAARDFYSKHGVTLIAAAYEAHEEAGEVPLMVTKHCLRWSFNLCPKQAKGVTGVQGQVRAEPMTLLSNGETLNLKFDCKPCEMHVMGKARKHILQSPPPSIVPLSNLPKGGAPIKFYAKRPETV